MSQNDMHLFQRIGTAAFTAEAVGIGVRCGFQDGIQAEQIQGLHGPVGHGGNAQRSDFAVTAFRDIHAAQRLGVVAGARRRCQAAVFNSGVSQTSPSAPGVCAP